MAAPVPDTHIHGSIFPKIGYSSFLDISQVTGRQIKVSGIATGWAIMAPVIAGYLTIAWSAVA